MRLSFLFAWFDMWVGLFWDKKTHWLYILPVPMCGIILKFKPPLLTIHRYYDLWYICDPEKCQIGKALNTSREAYHMAWTYYKRIKELESDEQT